MSEVVTEDTLLAGRIRLRQLSRGHRAGTDAVLLAAVVPRTESGAIIDVGAGTGAVGLMVAARAPAARVLLVERDPVLADLCLQNIALNGFGDRVTAVVADVLAPARERRAVGLQSGIADIVLTNPPWLETGRARSSPDPGRAAAHELPPDGLGRWLRSCADLLKPKGRLALIHRADRLGECLAHVGHGFGAVVIRPVHARADEPAIRILVTARKGSRAALTLAPPLVLHGDHGLFTVEAEALHRGDPQA